MRPVGRGAKQLGLYDTTERSPALRQSTSASFLGYESLNIDFGHALIPNRRQLAAVAGGEFGVGDRAQNQDHRVFGFLADGASTVFDHF